MPGSIFPTAFALVVFADHNADLCGVALDGALAVGPSTGKGRVAASTIKLPPPTDATGTIGPGPEGHADGTVEQASPDVPWRVSGSSTELSVLPLGPPAAHAAAVGFEQLCRVEGHLVDAEDEPISCLGMRAAHPRLDGAESLRAAYAWFSAGDALALRALRSGGSKGHDRDAVAATVFEDGAAVAVGDPRLSTTYAEDGAPLRSGLELWIEGEDGKVEYPRRAAAEALGGAIRLTVDGLQVSAHAMRWHSRGQVGDGVYVLVGAE